ncbi:hypothetical protein A2532_04660 [Candidatus Wolfebacteria bacterium RIFOXYD2_FULL_48_11]|nr:MAG: hypothetical protein A2532_04660 [Candidatus Wolfebacteria bacterium RIFOXYD2_FULL_48_11]
MGGITNNGMWQDDILPCVVIPAKAGVQFHTLWIPAFAGMTPPYCHPECSGAKSRDLHTTDSSASQSTLPTGRQGLRSE